MSSGSSKKRGKKVSGVYISEEGRIRVMTRKQRLTALRRRKKEQQHWKPYRVKKEAK